MKRADKSAMATRNLDLFISNVSEDEILNLRTMSSVRGGSDDGEANGSEPIVIIPKPPQQ
jgi:hypothetical protein